MLFLDDILHRVQKPARYTGGEWNSVVKDWDTAKVRVALTYPDIYEIGASNNGLQLLYNDINSRPDMLAERCYTPWLDMDAELRKAGIPLFSLENRRGLAEFDIWGFSLGWELTYTNVLNMLDLAGVPVLAADRRTPLPLILGGGTCVLNGEPMADFLDAMALGEGEQVMMEICEVVREMKDHWEREGVTPGWPERAALLRRLASLDGVYVPSLYEPKYKADGSLHRVEPINGIAPKAVYRRVVDPLPPIHTRPIVPYMASIHDRAFIEIQRGCTRGCRFCQAGVIYRPLRERSHEEIEEAVAEIIDNCGYTDIGLVSLSTSDFHDLPALVRSLHARYKDQNIRVQLPSLRVETVSVELVEALGDGRHGGFTFAPEAGSQRLRNAINKPLTEDDLNNAVVAAYSHGYEHIKLYYMIGLPSETLEDVQGIVDTAMKTLQTGRRLLGPRARVSVSVNIFIPKAHSQYQWAPMESWEQLAPKFELLRRGLRAGKNLKFSYTGYEESLLEAVMARGDRRIGKAIYLAWQRGARFDAWTDQMNWKLWAEVFAETGIDPEWYALRDRPLSEGLPWAHLHDGLQPGFLWREYRNTFKDKWTEDCRFGACTACGLQDLPGCKEKFDEMVQIKALGRLGLKVDHAVSALSEVH
ncbi:MAG: TIGR03960 family B12-binding radical SAM protein [Chloroflexi bacterium]|nr:TIGR03960 family B12-binding radical SAM protein [Chloroflexota bacterium]